LKATEAAQLILDATARGAELVLVIALETGDRAIVYPDGTVLGEIANARELAERVFAEREPVFVDGFFAELHAPAESLLVFGAGHIGVAVAELGAELGFAVTLLDDREEFPAHKKIDFATPLRELRIDENTYVVLVTRAHEYDFDCLRDLLMLEQQPRYIGLLGSRRRVRAAFTALLEAGVERAKLEKVHAPIGLDIGAETPKEIAISIAAELIKVRRGGTGESVAEEERVLERFFA
jgi:xanthine dehydrogenase accessory factor